MFISEAGGRGANSEIRLSHHQVNSVVVQAPVFGYGRRLSPTPDHASPTHHCSTAQSCELGRRSRYLGNEVSCTAALVVSSRAAALPRAFSHSPHLVMLHTIRYCCFRTPAGTRSSPCKRAHPGLETYVLARLWSFCDGVLTSLRHC